MKKHVLYIGMAVALLLAACAPAAAPAEPTAESVAVPTQAPACGSCRRRGAYTLPEGALVQPVPLAAGAQFTGTLAYKAGAKARIAYMPPVINPYYGAIEQGAKAQAERWEWKWLRSLPAATLISLDR